MKTLHILPLIVLSLILAIAAGWMRIGWNFPVTQSVAQHGALMVGSFLSTVIFLERSITFKNKLVLLLPAINGISALFFATGHPSIAQYCLLAGSIGFCIMTLHFIYRYHELYYYLFFVGAFCLSMGHWLLIKSQFYPQAVPWWMGFFLFTIVAERLELSKFLLMTRVKTGLLLFALLIAFVGLLIPFHLNGSGVFAVGLVLTSLWLFTYDMATISIRRPGQHRYSAILLLTGYLWLIITAIFLCAGYVNPFWYDATLHSFFLGFVISMIFSHAPIILPAVLNLSVKPYRSFLYIFFFLMQASLIVRIIADAFIMVELRRIAGLVNGLTLLVFFISIAAIVKSQTGRRVVALKA